MSYKWWFRSSDEETPFVMNPHSTNVDTEKELIVDGGDPTRTNGYYFCVMKNSISNDIAVSQLVSVHSGIDVTYYAFLCLFKIWTCMPT